MAGIGGKNKKKAKKIVESERELVFKEELQEYGQIIRLLGDSRLEIQCADGVKRMGHIRGKMRKKVWMGQGDVVLVALREYEKDKCDIIQKYIEDEVRKLKAYGEIPESFKLPEQETGKKSEGGDIEFEFIEKNNNKDIIISDDEDDEDDYLEEKKPVYNNVKGSTKKPTVKEIQDEIKDINIDDI